MKPKSSLYFRCESRVLYFYTRCVLYHLWGVRFRIKHTKTEKIWLCWTSKDFLKLAIYVKMEEIGTKWVIFRQFSWWPLLTFSYLLAKRIISCTLSVYYLYNLDLVRGLFTLASRNISCMYCIYMFLLMLVAPRSKRNKK